MIDTVALREQCARDPWGMHAPSEIVALCDEIDRLRAEIEFMRAWSHAHYGLMPPSREQNAAFMRALDETEGDRG